MAEQLGVPVMYRFPTAIRCRDLGKLRVVQIKRRRGEGLGGVLGIGPEYRYLRTEAGGVRQQRTVAVCCDELELGE